MLKPTGTSCFWLDEIQIRPTIVQGGAFYVRMKGDVDRDCLVNIIDVGSVNGLFGQNAGSSRYTSSVDLNNDRRINTIAANLVDISIGRHAEENTPENPIFSRVI